MTETKWTEGPWRAEGPDPFGDFNILHQADALAIAAVVSNMRPAEEVKANADLIAAAPALYDALYAVIYWRQQVDSTFGDRDANDKAISNVIANERIAIEVLARARGEQP